MKTTRTLAAGLAAVSLLGLSACVTDPNTGERKVSRTAIGAAGGAIAGAGILAHQVGREPLAPVLATAGAGLGFGGIMLVGALTHRDVLAEVGSLGFVLAMPVAAGIAAGFAPEWGGQLALVPMLEGETRGLRIAAAF